jgi:hypothetical protein
VHSHRCAGLAFVLNFRNKTRVSYYARNHLQDDWAAAAAGETAQALRDANRTAGWYFDRATRRQRAAHEAGMRALAGASAPERDRDREALRRRWREATAEAQMLFEASVACLLAGGEVSGELDEAWTALFAREDAGSCQAAE